MDLIYISYWGLTEGLTQSTVIPHLNLLADNSQIKSIHFVTIERNNSTHFNQNFDRKIKHQPIFSRNMRNVFLTKINDFRIIRKKLLEIVKNSSIDLIIARSSLSGALANSINRKTGIPYAVESFEPHADYMLESGVWKWFDPRYQIQKYWEKIQMRKASFLMPVSQNYANYLRGSGIDSEKIFVMPCAVDLNRFRFSSSHREEMRHSLGIATQSIVGIYVGKFGGIYMDEEAFEIFSMFETRINNFRLVILTPHDSNEVHKKLERANFSLPNALVRSVPFKDVPKYLSAADFAFSTIKPAAVRKYCSPIKDGEYWSSGLPIFIPDHIGDDSEIIRDTESGVIFTQSQLSQDVGRMIDLVNSKDREGFEKFIRPIAEKHRNFLTTKNIYGSMIESIVNRN